MQNSLHTAEAGIIYLRFPILTQLLLLKHFCNKWEEERVKGPSRPISKRSVTDPEGSLGALPPRRAPATASSCQPNSPNPALEQSASPSPPPIALIRGICLQHLFSILLRFLLIGSEKAVCADNWGCGWTEGRRQAGFPLPQGDHALKLLLFWLSASLHTL